MRPVERLLAALENVRRQDTGWIARCPAHDDRHPSLSVAEGDDGRALVWCFAGCSLEAVLAAVGLSVSDLFPPGGGRCRSWYGAVDGSTLTAERMHARPSTRSGKRCRWRCWKRSTSARSPSAESRPCGFRTSTSKGSSGLCGIGRRLRRTSMATIASVGARARSRFCMGSGGLIGLERSGTSSSSKAKAARRRCGSTATRRWVCLARRCGENRDARHFEEIAAIYVVVEPDKGGEAVVAWLGRSRIRDRVRLLTLPQGISDVSDLHVTDPERWQQRFEEALQQAIPWQDEQKLRQTSRRSDAWSRCQHLAQEPRLLDRFAGELAELGVVGEQRTAKLLYLVVTSRLLPRPVSAALKGAVVGRQEATWSSQRSSSSQPTPLTPLRRCPSARWPTPRSRSRTDARDLRGAGIQGEFVTYLRPFAALGGPHPLPDDREDGRGLRARLIEREGPTGLIMTTTEIALHTENETRLLSHPGDRHAGANQARAAHDRRRATRRTPTRARKSSDWVALQEWLALGDEEPSSSLTLRRWPRRATGGRPLAPRFRGHPQPDPGARAAPPASRDRDDRGPIVATSTTTPSFASSS